MIKVAIADDHPLTRQAVAQLLETEDDIVVLGEASNGNEVLSLIEDQPEDLDVLLLDVRMPEVSGLKVARRVSEAHPSVGVIMLSAYNDRELVVEAVQAGARGYVLKTCEGELLVQAVRLVASGHMVMDPDLVPFFAEEIAKAEGQPRRAETLTDREREVLRLLASGMTNKKIASELGVSPETVKVHLERIFRKLQTSDRTATIAEALRRNLIT